MEWVGTVLGCRGKVTEELPADCRQLLQGTIVTRPESDWRAAAVVLATIAPLLGKAAMIAAV